MSVTKLHVRIFEQTSLQMIKQACFAFCSQNTDFVYVNVPLEADFCFVDPSEIGAGIFTSSFRKLNRQIIFVNTQNQLINAAHCYAELKQNFSEEDILKVLSKIKKEPSPTTDNAIKTTALMIKKFASTAGLNAFALDNLNIFINSARARVYLPVETLDLNSPLLQKLAQAPLEHYALIDNSVVEERLIASLKEDLVFPHRVHEVAWALGLLAEHFSYPDYLTNQSLLRLNKWPDFGQLPHHPEHMMITAYLVQHAMSIEEIADNTGIDIHRVAQFINACYLHNLVTFDTKAPATNITVKKDVKDSKDDTLWKMMWKKLVNNK